MVSALLMWALVYRGIRLSTAASVLLGQFEVLVFTALAVTLIIEAGGANTAVFGPHTAVSVAE